MMRDGFESAHHTNEINGSVGTKITVLSFGKPSTVRVEPNVAATALHSVAYWFSTSSTATSVCGMWNMDTDFRIHGLVDILCQ